MGSLLCLQTTDVDHHTNSNDMTWFAKGLGLPESDKLNKLNKTDDTNYFASILPRSE